VARAEDDEALWDPPGHLPWHMQHKDGTLEHALNHRSLARLEHVLANDPSAATDPLLCQMGFDTPLCYAVRGHADAEMVRALLAAGSDPHLSDGDGRTPLMLCAGLYEVQWQDTCRPCPSGQPLGPRTSKLVTAQIEFQTELAETKEEEQIKVALLLLAAGADPNQLDSQGFTAGEIASGNGQMRLANLINDYSGIQSCELLERLHYVRDRSRCTLVSLPAHVLVNVEAFLIPEDVLAKLRQRKANANDAATASELR